MGAQQGPGGVLVPPTQHHPLLAPCCFRACSACCVQHPVANHVVMSLQLRPCHPGTEASAFCLRGWNVVQAEHGADYADAGAAEAAPHQPCPSPEQLAAMGVRQLRALLVARGGDPSTCVEKGDLVRALLAAGPYE